MERMTYRAGISLLIITLSAFSHLSLSQDLAEESQLVSEEISRQDNHVPIDSESDEAGVHSINEAFAQSTFKGLIRYNGMTRDSNMHATVQDASDPANDMKQYSTLGGYLGFETAPLAHFSMGATLYTSNPVGNNPSNREGLGGLAEGTGTGSQEAYHVLGEAFLKFQNNGNRVVLGRQEIPGYMFISTSNIRMTPITHEGLTYSNTQLDNVSFNAAYVSQMKERNSDVFIDMATGARLKAFAQEGSTHKAIVRGDQFKDTNNDGIIDDYGPNYDSTTGAYTGPAEEMMLAGVDMKFGLFSAKVWEYYIADFLNTTYLYADYLVPFSSSSLHFAGQYAKQDEVGDAVGGDIDTFFYGLRAQYSLNSGMSFFAGYNEVDYNEASYDGGTIFVRWGTPQMFNSFQVQDSELAGTKSVGVGAAFDLGQMGVVNGLYMRVRAGAYDMPDKVEDVDARQDRQEYTLDVRYSFEQDSGFSTFSEVDGLSLLLRLAYNDYKTTYDFESYKAVHGRSFEAVTDDFIDARLYIDYIF